MAGLASSSQTTNRPVSESHNSLLSTFCGLCDAGRSLVAVITLVDVQLNLTIQKIKIKSRTRDGYVRLLRPHRRGCVFCRASFHRIDMSQAAPAAFSSPSSSSFLPIFTAALEAYEKTTKKRLLTHPLAVQLQSCDSPAAILSVLQHLVQQLDESRRSDQGLTNWLSPTVNVLFAFSATLGEGVGLVGLESRYRMRIWGSDFHFCRYSRPRK